MLLCGPRSLTTSIIGLSRSKIESIMAGNLSAFENVTPIDLGHDLHESLVYIDRLHRFRRHLGWLLI